MILITHIIIALATVIASGWAAITPSTKTIQAAHALLAGTIVSGTVLVFMSPMTLTHACASGLAVTVVALALTRVARGRLARFTA